VMLTLAAQATRKGVIDEVMTHLGIFLAVIVLSLLVFVCYGYAPKITEHISAQTAHGILRVIAFVLLCIGVQITWNGVDALMKTVLRP
jgi:multiple antibiotic resistance protein